MNIILSGMPLAGKSTVLKELEKSGYETYDSDEEITKLFGDISEIFSNFGEEGFRNFESEVIKKLCKKDGVVIALGGGTLTRENNVKVISENGKIVYLKASINTLLSRAEGNDTRPLLRGDRRKNLEKLFLSRKGIFEKYCDLEVETDGKTPKEIVMEILNNLKGI